MIHGCDSKIVNYFSFKTGGTRIKTNLVFILIYKKLYSLCLQERLSPRSLQERLFRCELTLLSL